MNRRSIIAGLVVLTSVAAGFIATAPAYADALETITKSGSIRIAVPQDYAPFGSVGPDLKPLGYDIDTANLIARDLGVKLELVAVTSANRIPYLQTKKVDLVISTLGKNEERERVIDFSTAYAPFFQGLFGLKSAAIAKPEDLAGKTVGATRGAMEEQELSRMAPPTTIIKRFEDNSATVAAFLSGQIDLIATGNTVAAAIAERNPARAPVVKFVIKDSPCFIGLNKGEGPLLAKVNAIIEKAKASGELGRMSEKWLKAPLPAGL